VIADANRQWIWSTGNRRGFAAIPVEGGLPRDFIDRGPRIQRGLEVVRPMVEAGHALAVMGNH
jgi:hypothetical protein